MQTVQRIEEHFRGRVLKDTLLSGDVLFVGLKGRHADNAQPQGDDPSTLEWTTDGGLTWNRIPQLKSTVYKIIDLGSGIVFVAAKNGIYGDNWVTKDNGATWSRLDDSLQINGNNAACYTMMCRTSSGKILFSEDNTVVSRTRTPSLYYASSIDNLIAGTKATCHTYLDPSNPNTDSWFLGTHLIKEISPGKIVAIGTSLTGNNYTSRTYIAYSEQDGDNYTWKLEDYGLVLYSTMPVYNNMVALNTGTDVRVVRFENGSFKTVFLASTDYYPSVEFTDTGRLVLITHNGKTYYKDGLENVTLGQYEYLSLSDCEVNDDLTDQVTTDNFMLQSFGGSDSTALHKLGDKILLTTESSGLFITHDGAETWQPVALDEGENFYGGSIRGVNSYCDGKLFALRSCSTSNKVYVSDNAVAWSSNTPPDDYCKFIKSSFQWTNGIIVGFGSSGAGDAGYYVSYALPKELNEYLDKHGLATVIDQIKNSSGGSAVEANEFVGTQEDWDALTPEEQNAYDKAYIKKEAEEETSKEYIGSEEAWDALTAEEQNAYDKAYFV